MLYTSFHFIQFKGKKLAWFHFDHFRQESSWLKWIRMKCQLTWFWWRKTSVMHETIWPWQRCQFFIILIQYTINISYSTHETYIYIHIKNTHTHTHLRKKKKRKKTDTYDISNRKTKQITFSIRKKGPLPTVFFWKKNINFFHLPGLSSKNCGKGGITDPWLYRNHWWNLYHVPTKKTPGFKTHPIFHKTGPLGIGS